MSIMEITRRAYFATWYNTTSLVNVMLTLGVITPYVIVGEFTGHLSTVGALTAILITILATYCYNIIYIVNDFLDREKDLRLGTPKMTASHVLGTRYLPIVLGVFAAIIALDSSLFPQLTLPLVGYCLLLAGLSVLHSRAHQMKLLTIFAERLAKFVMPLVFMSLISQDVVSVNAMLVAALLMFPVSHTFDYAYRGYIRDRLHWPESIRFVVYAGYFALLAIAIGPGLIWPAFQDHLKPILFYGGLYQLISATSDLLAPSLPVKKLDDIYDPHVAWEKRRLLTYGLLQLLLMVLGGIYAIFS